MSYALDRRTVLNGLLLTAATSSVFRATPAQSPASQGLAATLLASGPHPSLGHHADTFGRLIGSWAGHYRDRDETGAVEEGPMEVHFGWVLDGRAVQDTFIAPPRGVAAPANSERRTYGTTIRVFDPKTESWLAVWHNPITGVRNDLVGRRVRDDIVNFCTVDERPEKWLFTQIKRDSFLWQAFSLANDGLTWELETDFRLHRIA